LPANAKRAGWSRFGAEAQTTIPQSTRSEKNFFRDQARLGAIAGNTQQGAVGRRRHEVAWAGMYNVAHLIHIIYFLEKASANFPSAKPHRGSTRKIISHAMVTAQMSLTHGLHRNSPAPSLVVKYQASR